MGIVTWIPPELLRTVGSLGLCHSPGSQGCPRDEDLDALVGEGVQHVICLQEPHELALLREPETLVTRCRAVEGRGMRFTHEPIVDFDAPSVVRAACLTRLIVADLEVGVNVVVHCWAGLGRSGTVAACVLVASGHSAQEAVALLRAVRPGAVQSIAQERLIKTFADRFRSDRN